MISDEDRAMVMSAAGKEGVENQRTAALARVLLDIDARLAALEKALAPIPIPPTQAADEAKGKRRA